jgi:hypothetical protein
MFADPTQSAARRLRRRIKAGASIAVALVAGAFLACRPGANNPGPSPSGPDARVGPERTGGSAPPPPPEPDAATADAASESTDALADARSDDGGRDASLARPTRAPRAPQVDRHEHRNGMPVRDNLLE